MGRAAHARPAQTLSTGREKTRVVDTQREIGARRKFALPPIARPQRGCTEAPNYCNTRPWDPSHLPFRVDIVESDGLAFGMAERIRSERVDLLVL